MIVKSYPDEIARGAEGIPCECGGYADRDNRMTAEEIRGRGCGRDREDHQCCARAFVCRLCKMRWLGSADSPDMDYS